MKIKFICYSNIYDILFFQFFQKLKEKSEEYTVNLLCEALQISKATYYNRKLRGKNGKTENQKRREELLPIIREIYHESGQIYGTGKIAAIMKDRCHKITERVVASIMHENGMFSMRNCAKTLYLMNQERKENILKQEFKVDEPNSVWVSDVTCYHYNNRTYYIAFYNSERPHSLLRYQTPAKYEEMYYFYNPNRTCVVQEEQ